MKYSNFDNTAIMIPIRGVKKSMSRLRNEIKDEEVNRLVDKLFKSTLSAIQNINIPVFVLTSEPDFGNSEDFLKTNIDFVIDDGSGLNKAIESFVDNNKFERYLLIMPDLPGLTETIIHKIASLVEIHQNVIANTQDMGTACCILPKKFFTAKLFGPKSAEKIINLAEEEKIPLSQLEITELKFDLDTIDDYNYWIDSHIGL